MSFTIHRQTQPTIAYCSYVVRSLDLNQLRQRLPTDPADFRLLSRDRQRDLFRMSDKVRSLGRSPVIRLLFVIQVSDASDKRVMAAFFSPNRSLLAAF